MVCAREGEVKPFPEPACSNQELGLQSWECITESNKLQGLKMSLCILLRIGIDGRVE